MFETQFQREFPIDSNSVSCSVGELTEYTLKQIKEHFKYSQLKFKAIPFKLIISCAGSGAAAATTTHGQNACREEIPKNNHKS